MPYIAAVDHIRLGRPVGDGECVALVQAYANAPNTGSWHRGLQVRGHGAQIARGTAIATFVNGVYPSDERHAAIFLEETSNGIRVIDQWQGQPAHERVIHFGSTGRQNDPNAYFVID